MRRDLLAGILALAGLACSANLPALSPPPGSPAPPSPVSTQAPDLVITSQAAPTTSVVLPAGTTIGLELQDSLHTRYTKKGDAVSFKVSPAVMLGGRVVIPQDTTVDGSVILAKRAGIGHKQGELRLDFTRLVLPDGTSLPLKAQLARAGRWNRSSSVTSPVSSDRDAWQDISQVAQMAIGGALAGDAIGGSKGAAYGAAAGAAVAILAVALQRGPELDLPAGFMFQVELKEPISLPVAAFNSPELADASPPPASQMSQAVPTSPETAGPAAAAPEPVVAARPSSTVEVSPPEPANPSANAVPDPPGVRPPSAGESVAGLETGVTFTMDVNLVMVDATVRDERGGIYIKLKRDDFRILEDGVEQHIRHFSRDELPLAVALVIDRSGSVAPVLDRLRRAARETLSQLKTGDQVALFQFDSQPELLVELTADRRMIAEAIAQIEAGGSTNIKDALFEAAMYLGREAPTRRHAIILISDNQETARSRADDGEVIRTALETESVIYGIKVEDRSGFNLSVLPFGRGAVNRITRETGGEVFDTRELGSVEAAMQAVVSRLKLRFTLGYNSTNTRRDGAYRRIDVRLAGDVALPRGLTVYARRGYYAPRPAAN